ncbi:carbamoyltransferase C-terminal domain-containing protein [Nocardia sp. NPDC056952]|uniref:carbamoyltransferase C-terminal domain-containing protein n=1 Tax=Nocardia sp. NPDC056952 TaxID=3345979 RepID=UPI0036276357
MSTRILGLNLSHDASACLVVDGIPRSALALERRVRIKRGTVPLHLFAAEMSRLVHDLLAIDDLSVNDVDYWIATSTESRDEQDEAGLLDTLGLMVAPQRRLTLPHPGHHLAHASAAFYSSGFDSAGALVIDSYGSRLGSGRERETALTFALDQPPQVLFRTRRQGWRIAGRDRNGSRWIPTDLAGIGEIYRVLTLALGFAESGTTYDDAGKTMGLASFGHRLSAEPLFITTDDSGELTFDRASDSLLELGLAVRCEDGLELKPRQPGEPLTDFHHNLAAQVQHEFEEACLNLARRTMKQSGNRRLVLSGGAFLNSVTNTRIREETEADEIFVFPAATDDGNAIGAALYAYHVLTASDRPTAGIGEAPPTILLGPPRLPADIETLAGSYGLRAQRHERGAGAHAAAAAIARGEIIGWFQSRSEFGPRALGARSILCHPGIAGMKDRLNARVKHRESFRPFAASVMAEHAEDWFSSVGPSSRFMLLVCPVHPEKRDAISEVTHIDGTCRVQTVYETDGAYHELLAAFDRLVGLPLVLNTSFNVRGEPIVEFPVHAIDALFSTRIDRVFIGDFEISAPDYSTLIPIRNDDSPGDHVQPNGTSETQLLAHIDGNRSMSQISTASGIELDAAIDAAMWLRRGRTLRWRGLPHLADPGRLLPAQYEPHELGASR